MTPEQVTDWLGYDAREVHLVQEKWPHLFADMAETPAPTTLHEHVFAFSVFLASTSKPGGEV